MFKATPTGIEGARASDTLLGKVDAAGEKASPYEALPRLDKRDDHTLQVQTIPWRYKASAGLMILLFAFGSSLSETTLGPLKSTLIKELRITSELSICTVVEIRLTSDAQYGTIASASSLVNTILPIVGGIYMDHVSDLSSKHVAADVTCSGEQLMRPLSPVLSF